MHWILLKCGSLILLAFAPDVIFSFFGLTPEVAVIFLAQVTEFFRISGETLMTNGVRFYDFIGMSDGASHIWGSLTALVEFLVITLLIVFPIFEWLRLKMLILKIAAATWEQRKAAA